MRSRIALASFVFSSLLVEMHTEPITVVTIPIVIFSAVLLGLAWDKIMSIGDEP